MTKLKPPTKWASQAEIQAAEEAFPRDLPDAVNVRRIMEETGLSEDTARLALWIIRGDSEGDCLEIVNV